MPEVHEEVINVNLAQILSRELNIPARAERIRDRRRLDIRCYYRGLKIGIETSYEKRDAERDAEERINQGLAHIALALWIKQRFKDMPETELTKAIGKSKFDVKVFVPLDLRGTLLQFFEEGIVRKVEPVTGWIEDVDLPAIKTIIEGSIRSFIVRERDIQRLIDNEIKPSVDDFIKVLKNLDRKGIIRENLYKILYKLYGLSIAEAQDPDVIFGHGALSILLSATFYEHMRGFYPQLKPISRYCDEYGSIEGLKRALKDLYNEADCGAAVKPGMDVLDTLPPDIAGEVKDLIDLAIKIASERALLNMDFAGRIYHEVAGGIALKKGFATFYTEVPAAHLLATLATLTLLDLDERDFSKLDQRELYEIIDRIKSAKVGDLACGSGTLITASYNALTRIVEGLKFCYNLEEVDPSKIGKTLIEEGIYGIDALRYASQITATNLALMGPGTIAKENTYTIFLGCIPRKNEPWLGSLELLNNGSRVGGLLAFIEGELNGIAERVTLRGSDSEFSIPAYFDMIIMNPPFTRPTYRGRRVREEERAFFGFMANEETRERLRDKYREILDRISGDLRGIAQDAINHELKDIPNEIKGIITGEADTKLRQYLNIGLAGEALPFLYLAYKYVKKDGVIAFVLPRAVLAGVSWFLARILLASKFHLKYVIISSDSENGYNFSEGASLSETLLVAKKVDRHEPSEETVFIILTKKPRTMLEGILTASSIVEAKKRRIIQPSDKKVEFIVRTVDRGALLKHIDNWNKFVAIHEPILSDYIFKLLTEGIVTIDKYNIEIPLVKLSAILRTLHTERRQREESVKSIGIDAHQFYDLYARVGVSPYPALIGTGEESRKSMRIRPNANIMPKSEDVRDKAISTFRAFAGRILVPGVNVWWDTSHVIVLYSDQEILSNTHYAIKLDVDPSIEPYAEKALVLWFNTTWGLLSILANREETRGRWAQVKMGQWMLMPVLDVTSLDYGVLKRLAEIFDKYAEKELKRIPKQFNPTDPDPVRLGIDREFIKVLNPTIDDKILERELVELYKHVDMALRVWIGTEQRGRGRGEGN
jgi:hypothetical protein